MNLFDDAEMATGYASARPPVHEPVMDRVAAARGWTDPMGVMLDVGCGAGLSTRAALPWARAAIGVDPAPEMVAAALEAVPRASFVAGAGEHLPIASETIDVITSAGSLNFMNVDQFAREASRVLRADGVVVAYDFLTGSRCAPVPELALTYGEFAGRWTRPTSNRVAIDPQVLRVGPFDVVVAETFLVTIDMTLDAYVDYLMTETYVAAAVQGGEYRDGIRADCLLGFAPTFTTALPIDFDAWFAVMRPRE